MGSAPSRPLFQYDGNGEEIERTTPAGQNAGEQPTQGPEVQGTGCPYNFTHLSKLTQGLEAAPTTPSPPPPAQTNGQETPTTPAGSVQQRRHGLGPLYARRGGHGGFPRRSTPRGRNADQDSIDTPSDLSGNTESIYSETTEPDDDGKELIAPSFLVTIYKQKGWRRFCKRLRGEGEPLHQGWQVVNFLSQPSRIYNLQKGIENVHNVFDVDYQLAPLPVDTVLSHIANSRPGNPLSYWPDFDVAYTNVVWQYYINLSEKRLIVYGPPSLTWAQVPIEDRYRDDLNVVPPRGRLPRRLRVYTFDELREFNTPQAFQESVYASFGQDAREIYSLPRQGRERELYIPTELDNNHRDARSHSVTTASTEEYVIPSSSSRPPSPPDEDGSPPRLGSPIQFTTENPRRQSLQYRTPTPGPARPPLFYPPEPQHNPQNRPLYNRHGSPWEPGDTPPPGSEPSLDYGQSRYDSGENTEIEEGNMSSTERRRSPRNPVAPQEPSSPVSGVILRLPTDENSSPIRHPHPDEPRTPPWYWRRPSPHHPSSSSSPMDVRWEFGGGDDSSPTVNVMAARRRMSEERRRNPTPELPPPWRSPPPNPDVWVEEPVESDVSDNGSDNYESSPIGVKKGSKRRREEQDQSNGTSGEAGESTSLESSPPAKKLRREEESNSTESRNQAKPGPPDSESDLPDYESDPHTPSPNAKRPNDTLTEDDLPNMESDPEASAPPAKRQRQASSLVGSSKCSGGGAYPSHLKPPHEMTSYEQRALDLEKTQKESYDQATPAPAWENEQPIFRNPQWNLSSSQPTSDEESPKSMRNSPQNLPSSSEDDGYRYPSTSPIQGLYEPVDRFDDKSGHLWRRFWPGGVRGGPTSNIIYQAGPEGVEEADDVSKQNGRSGSWPAARPDRPGEEGYRPIYNRVDEPDDLEEEGAYEQLEAYGEYRQLEEEGSDTYIRLGSTPPSDWDATTEI